MSNDEKFKESVTGSVLGTAIGDALGLSCEGLSKRRQGKMFPDINKYHFFFGNGMVSDDTEHTLLVGEALLESGGNPGIFLKKFAWKLRFWVMALPAGIGFATLKACMKLWMGFSGDKSGVYSAGNGPAMRSPVIGVMYGENTDKMKEMVRLSTRITHTDPKAEWGAQAAALAAYMSSKYGNEKISPDDFVKELAQLLGEEAHEFLSLVEKAAESAKNSETTEEFARKMGLEKGVGGYIFHTMPVVLQSWLLNQGNFRKGLQDVIRCGGDADTTGAIIGGILGAGTGEKGIPKEWLDNLREWPRSVEWMKSLAEKLSVLHSEGQPINPPHYNYLLTFPRNFIFTMTVLAHGFRRMLPPY